MSPERDYVIPRKLCELDVPKRYYAPLFGPGKEVEEDQHWKWGNPKDSQGCNYFVDGDVTVYVMGRWARRNDSIESSTPGELIEEHDSQADSRKYLGRYDVVTWSSGAVAAINCVRAKKSPERSVTRFLVDIYANDTPLNDDPDRAHKVFGELAQVAAVQIEKKLPCQGG
ncbi:hypothetical protein [Streptomyces sp. WMMB303]|uniref:hypothetical protein n=1 Tax=Streptomyces sp. WMMB303 TaxID=3034154 RepID=UPI0023EB54F3|nr:hypothetical protein [Streptomyces sp. WMMB303]MDF4250322.1 hypothetical protein [Streptomyces sp. WMMB303]